jgi:Tol biopolymer transport system component
MEGGSMKALSRNKSVPFVFVLWLITLLCISPLAFAFQKSNKQAKIAIGGFSPDNQLLSLDYCPNRQACYAILLDWRTGAVSKLTSPDPDQYWESGRFSPSGKYMAFSIKRKSDNFRTSQIGLYDVAAKSIRILTNTQTYKGFPSFSPDEKRLIFMQANRERESGKTRFSDWDVYELNIESKAVRRLTNYEFFLIDRPFFMPDGKRFIFSGEAPFNFVGDDGQKGHRAYLSKYQENTIFILGQENSGLQPAFTNGSVSISPRISRDGKRIAYVSRTNELDKLIGKYNYDIFIFENGRHRRLTALKTSLTGMDMSSDGTMITFLSDPERNNENQLWLLDLSTGQYKRINVAENTVFSNNR